MSLMTQCPTCSTLFRVTQDQLQAHGGKVRCGSCKTVFDGLKALAALPEPVPGAQRAAGSDELDGFELRPVEATAAAAASSPAAVGDERSFGPAPEQLTLDDELFADPGAARRDRLWAVAAVVLIVALAGQAVHFYRADLAVQVPGLKPTLVQLCELLSCMVAPPQRPRQIAIEASDLQATDTARPGTIQLTATLRNHAEFDLGFPALDLVLTDTKEHALARRVFLPKEYLARDRDIMTGIPANAEITVRLDLDTGDLNPAGFRIDLLPAP